MNIVMPLQSGRATSTQTVYTVTTIRCEYTTQHPDLCRFGSIAVWIVQSLAGIQPHPAARGMDRVLIKPQPPKGLDWFTAWFDTPRGRILSAWTRDQSGVHLNITIPPNMHADVHVPTNDGRTKRHMIGSGQHIFSSV